jgi:recombination protein RecT
MTEVKKWSECNIVERRSTIEDLLKKNKEKLLMALPKHLTPEKLIGTVLTSFQRNPKLLECTQSSLLGAIWTAAQLGLNPNGLLGEGYLQPYRNNRRGVTECQFIPGYRGYIKLAYQSGQVQTFQAECVYENDHFVYEKGLNQKLEHIPSKPPRGLLIAVYVIVRLNNGGVLFDMMYKEDVELIRLASPGKDSPSWENHYDEMAKKTVCRRISKITPVSTELETAAGLDEKAELLGESQRTDLALLDVDLSSDINQEIEQTTAIEAQIIDEEKINERAEKGKKALNNTIQQLKTNGNGNGNGNGKLKHLQEGVSYRKQMLREAEEKGNKKKIEECKKELEDAVQKVNDYLKNKENATPDGGQDSLSKETEEMKLVNDIVFYEMRRNELSEEGDKNEAKKLELTINTLKVKYLNLTGKEFGSNEE